MVVQRLCECCTIAGRSCNGRTTVARPPSDRATVVRVLHDLRAIVRSLLRSYDWSCNGRTTLLRSKSIASGRKRSQLFFEHVQNSKSIADDRSRSHAPCDRSHDPLRSVVRSRSQAVGNWSQRNCERGLRNTKRNQSHNRIFSQGLNLGPKLTGA